MSKSAPNYIKNYVTSLRKIKNNPRHLFKILLSHWIKVVEFIFYYRCKWFLWSIGQDLVTDSYTQCLIFQNLLKSTFCITSYRYTNILVFVCIPNICLFIILFIASLFFSTDIKLIPGQKVIKFGNILLFLVLRTTWRFTIGSDSMCSTKNQNVSYWS